MTPNIVKHLGTPLSAVSIGYTSTKTIDEFLLFYKTNPLEALTESLRAGTNYKDLFVFAAFANKPDTESIAKTMIKEPHAETIDTTITI